MMMMMMMMMFVPVYIYIAGSFYIDSYNALPNTNCTELQQDFILEKFRRRSLYIHLWGLYIKER